VSEVVSLLVVAQGTEVKITTACRYHNVLARFTPVGLHLWCRGCRDEAVISWEELDGARRSVAISERTCYSSR
jgi:hypothetical protein